MENKATDKQLFLLDYGEMKRRVLILACMNVLFIINTDLEFIGFDC